MERIVANGKPKMKSEWHEMVHWELASYKTQIKINNYYRLLLQQKTTIVIPVIKSPLTYFSTERTLKSNDIFHFTIQGPLSIMNETCLSYLTEAL
jgi:hypothetical protein